MTILYRNPRAFRLRIVQAAVWISAAIIFWLAANVGRNPRDTTADVVVAWGGAIFMAACLAGIELFLRHYLLRIERTEAGVRLVRLGTLWHVAREVKREDVRVSTGRSSRSPPGMEPGWDNSWVRLDINGQRIPIIVDTTPPAQLDRPALLAALRRS